MVKIQNVRLTVHNQSGSTMALKGDWYDSGRLADSYKWPETLTNGSRMDILNYERDYSTAGCSGYVSYDINGTVVTFAFSNPIIGTNKLGVGTGGETVWDNMGYHEYNEFTVRIGKLRYECRCTGGTTNHATVNIFGE